VLETLNRAVASIPAMPVNVPIASPVITTAFLAETPAAAPVVVTQQQVSSPVQKSDAVEKDDNKEDKKVVVEVDKAPIKTAETQSAKPLPVCQ
jgi:hypothetical protein